MTHIKRLTPLLLAGLVVCALLFPPFTQNSFSKRSPRRAAATVVARPDGQAIKLPGEIKLSADDVVPVHPERKPLATVPFTAEQLQPLVGTHLKMVNGQPAIQLKNGQLASLAHYAQQLTVWEHYLNQLGYTLRDGPLALPERAGKPPTPKVHGDDLGPILMLKGTKQTDSDHNKDKLPGQKVVDKPTRKPLLPDFTIVEDPYVVAANPNIRVRRGGAVSYLPRNRGGARTNSAYRVPKQNSLALKNLHYKRLPLPAQWDVPAPRAMDAPMPCGPSKATGCPCYYVGPGCQNGVQVAPDGSQIIDCGAALNPLDPEGSNAGSSGTPASGEVTTGGDSCGDKSAGDPSCLFEPKGSMHAKWAGIGSCANSQSGNSWFGVSVCSEMTFTGDQMDANLFLNNSGEMHFGVKLFGKNFDLLEGSAYSQYDGQLSSGTTVTVPLFGVELSPELYSNSYEMPKVTIPLAGVVDLTITGGGVVNLGFDQNSAPFNEPPHSCGSTDKGLLGLNLGSHAYADLHLTAALDAVVASAGIKGVLVLADDKIGLEMTDTINPSGNEIVVSPSFNYHVQHMAGHVYAVLTVDLIVYSKTFEVELFNFDGYHPPDKSVKIPPRTFSSKVE